MSQDIAAAVQPIATKNEIAIQPAARPEILRLHKDLIAKAKAFEESRVVFGEFMKAVRHSLNIADDQVYHIKEDATAFYQLDTNATPGVTE